MRVGLEPTADLLLMLQVTMPKLLSDVGLTDSYRYTMLPGLTANDLTQNVTNTNKYIDHRSYTLVSSVPLSSTIITIGNRIHFAAFDINKLKESK